MTCIVPLSGTWSLSDADGGFACAMTLPGDGITALVDAGHLPDPYEGRNEYACRWPADRDWVATREFDVEEDDLDLVIEGLDTVAEVLVNGTPVLDAANSFRIFRVDLSGVLRPGKNRIEILFRSNTRAADKAQAAAPYNVPWHQGNCPIGNGNMLRKVQCDFGWDWNIALAPFGVTGNIRLERRHKARIDAVIVMQDHTKGGVHVSVTALIKGADTGHVDVSLCGQTVSADIRGGRAECSLLLKDPDLWWPAGLGAQTLHDMVLTLDGQTVTRRIGLVDIRHIIEPDDAGACFKFRVNGHDTFARGANWIPADALAGRITREKTRDLLQSAVDANMNMIRVWGGGRYEPDWFYNMCDEMGLMVWQDFMFACNLYPANDAFLTEVAAEVRDQVRRLNHHPCIALWCGDNELVGALNWYPESRANRDRYLVAYDRLNRNIETALTAELPDANWWPSSPAAGKLDFGDAWHDDSKGDMHFWSVWHEGRDFDHYRKVNPRFCSEFGFQSYTSMPVIRRFAEPRDMNIASPVMESHQKNAGGNARIAETMFRYFRFPEGFENFVWLSQVQQAMAIRTAVDYWRSLKPHCMGTLYWQLNDTWPVASWSSLDHGGSWKLLHYMARRFFAPATVVAIPCGERVRLVGINDLWGPIEMETRVLAVSMSGARRELGRFQGPVGTDAAVEIGQVAADAVGPDEVLVHRWTASTGDTGTEHLGPILYKALPLRDAHISATSRRENDGWSVLLSARSTALFVTLEADVPGRFSDNAIALLPGDDVRIQFTPDDTGTTPDFTVRDLFSATCVIPTQAAATPIPRAS